MVTWGGSEAPCHAPPLDRLHDQPPRLHVVERTSGDVDHVVVQPVVGDERRQQPPPEIPDHDQRHCQTDDGDQPGPLIQKLTRDAKRCRQPTGPP